MAVLPVVAYHAKLPGISGGFVGVDVFFVISGFLIVSIISREIDQNNFSILRFYERRARRILPALFAMVLFTCLIGLIVLLPSEFVDFPAQVLGALFFVANIVFWRQTNYFSDAADSNLLLHTWSLGVEEQFYIVAPILLIILARYLSSWRNLSIAAITIASLLLCIALTPSFATASFYLLPTRAWELGVGAMIALGIVPSLSNRIAREILAASGLAMILASVVFFDSEMEFPGYAALAPVIGAALVIHSGHGTRVGSILSLKPMVLVGLISYSLYLWHWPIFVAGDLYGMLDGQVVSFAFIALALIVGWLSWRFIERPFRSSQSVSQFRLWTSSAVTALVLAIAALGMSMLNGWPQRFDQTTLAFDAASNDISPRRDDCHISEGLISPEERCFLGVSDDGQEPLIVWSDSHGVEVSYALSEDAEVHSITYSGCPPILGFSWDKRPECLAHNVQVFDYLSALPQPRQIVLAAYFDWYADTDGLVAKLVSTISSLEDQGHSVVVMGPTPGPGANAPKFLARGGDPEFDLASDANGTAEVRAMLDRVDQETQADIVRPSDLVCKGSRCSLLIDGSPILFDDDHPSMTMAREIAVLIRGAIDE